MNRNKSVDRWTDKELEEFFQLIDSPKCTRFAFLGSAGIVIEQWEEGANVTHTLSVSTDGQGRVRLSVARREGTAVYAESDIVLPLAVWDFLRMHGTPSGGRERFGILPLPSGVSGSESVRRAADAFLPVEARAQPLRPIERAERRVPRERLC